jgi:hypothetical protein
MEVCGVLVFACAVGLGFLLCEFTNKGWGGKKEIFTWLRAREMFNGASRHTPNLSPEGTCFSDGSYLMGFTIQLSYGFDSAHHDTLSQL